MRRLLESRCFCFCIHWHVFDFAVAVVVGFISGFYPHSK
jgi:hypothetical protein